MAASREDSVAIAVNGSNSSALVNPGWALVAEVHAPSVLAETCTVMSAANAAGTYNTLQSGGANVSIAAATATVIYPAPTTLLFHLASNAANTRTFTVLWRSL